MRYLRLFVLFVTLYSCSSRFDFEFEKNKSEYTNVVKCVITNYAKIFDSSGIGNSRSLYIYDFEKKSICSDWIDFLKKTQIEFVNVKEDSTVAFYSKLQGSIKTRQFALMINNHPQQKNPEMPLDFTIKKVHGNRWYELERVISVAN